MSRDLRDFARYFMQGLQIGGGWAEKWEERRLQEARQAILDKQNAVKEAREQRKLDLYAQSVGANVDLARARAQRLMQPRGGGAGAGGGGSPVSDELAQRAADRGIVMKQNPPPPANVTNVYQTDGDGGGDGGPIAPPDGMRRGGMVRARRMARGGKVGDTFMSSFQSAMSKYGKQDDDKEKKGQTIVPEKPATGPPTAITPAAPTQISTPP